MWSDQDYACLALFLPTLNIKWQGFRDLTQLLSHSPDAFLEIALSGDVGE